MGSHESFFMPKDMLYKLGNALAGQAGHNADWITFVDSGEPTFNVDLGAML